MGSGIAVRATLSSRFVPPAAVLVTCDTKRKTTLLTPAKDQTPPVNGTDTVLTACRPGTDRPSRCGNGVIVERGREPPAVNAVR